MFHGASEKNINLTYDDKVLSSDGMIPEDLSSCNHEYYWSVLHSFHMSKCGMNKIVISTMDTNVATIAISSFNKMMLQELWFKSGSGEHRCYITIHKTLSAPDLGESKSFNLFNSFTGCDHVPYFAKCGNTKLILVLQELC